MPHYITKEELNKAKNEFTSKVSIVKSGEKEIWYDFVIKAYTVITPECVHTSADEQEIVNRYNSYQPKPEF